MKKYNIVFLFILLLFIGLSKNINMTTNVNSLTTNNVDSSIRTNALYPDNDLITFDVNSDNETATIRQIDITNITGTLNIPSVVYDNSGKSYIVTKVQGYNSSTKRCSIIGSGINQNSYDGSPNYTITNIVFPDTLISIGSTSLRGCSGLRKLIIPKNVKIIESSAIQFQYNLEEVYFLSSNIQIEGYNFWSDKVSIYKSFYFLNGNIDSVGTGLFGGNATLPQITVYIFDESYYEDYKQKFSSYTNITISQNYVYKYSTEFDIVYDSSLKTILMCTISIPKDILIVPSYIDEYKTEILSISPNAYSNNLFFTSVEIQDGITTIKDSNKESTGAFANCNNLKKVVLPNSITTIGNYAFTNCNTKIIFNDNILPDSITTIGNYAFYGTYIDELRLGSNLTTIGNYAFGENEFLKNIYINSNIQSLGTNLFSGTTTNNNNVRIIFSSKKAYSDSISKFNLYSTQCTYKVLVEYQNVGLYNNPSFSTKFQNELNNKEYTVNNDGVNVYTYYAGEDLLIPSELDDYVSYEGQSVALYIDSSYKISIVSNSTSDGQITAGKLTKGTVNNTLIIYCNLYIDPTNENNQGMYEIGLFDSNNNPVSNTFTSSALNNVVNIRFTNDKNTGTTGLPVVGYTYTYTWYARKSNSTAYTLISNNNDKEPSTLTLIPISGKDLNITYRCLVNITSTNTNSTIIMSKDITLTYEKEDITIVVNDQTVSNNGIISNTYGIDYYAIIGKDKLTVEEMNLYFGKQYGLVSKSNNGNIEISFFGTLQEPYNSNYNLNALQRGILIIKTNSTNLILIFVTSGLFVIEIIVFMVVIFKQRSKRL